MPVVMDFIRVRRVRGISDEMIQSLLELISELLSPPGSMASKTNTAFLLTNAEHLDALLDLLEDSDLHTTILTLQVGYSTVACGCTRVFPLSSALFCLDLLLLRPSGFGKARCYCYKAPRTNDRYRMMVI